MGICAGDLCVYETHVYIRLMCAYKATWVCMRCVCVYIIFPLMARTSRSSTYATP